MKKVFTLLMLTALFVPLALNAQWDIVQKKDIDYSSMPRISLNEIDSKDGDRSTTTLMTQNFDGMNSIATSYSPTGWFAYNAGSGNNWTLNTYSTYAHSGSKSAQYSYHSSNAADCYLVSAPFDVSDDMSTLSVSLYERTYQRYSLYYERFEVFFVKASEVTDNASVVSATRYSAINSDSYTNTTFAKQAGYTRNLALAGESVRVVVHCTSYADQYYLWIDDIEVAETVSDSNCPVATLPHFNGFETEEEYGCWTLIGMNCYRSTSLPRTGNTCYRFDGLDHQKWNLLVSPEFDGTSAMELSFYYRSYSTAHDQFYEIGYTTESDLTNIIWCGTEISHTTTYTECTEVFPKGTKYVIISVFGRVGEDSYFLVDDINITGGCIRPKGLEASNVTPKTAGLNWGDYSDNGYNVRYRTVTRTPDGNPQTRFSDDFTSSSLSTTLWHIENQSYSNSSTNWAVRSIEGVTPYGGSGYYASSRSFDGTTDHSVKNWLVTNQSMTLGNVVKFYMKENYPSWLDHIEVLVSTDNLTFVSAGAPTVSSADWEEITIDLSKYEGRTGYVAILHEDEANDYVAIDNFGVYKYNYTYTHGPWQYADSRSNSFTLTGLTAETTYEVQVQSSCGSDWSPAIEFTTPDDCTSPVDLAAENVTPISASLSWSDYQESYEVRYRGRMFYESFDRGIPSTWTNIDADGDNHKWEQSRYGMNGTTCAASASYLTGVDGGPLTPDNWLITPQVDLGGYLEMWVKGQDDEDFEEYYTIYVSTATTATTDFSELTHGTTTQDYQKVTVDLSSYAGRQGYIAIRHHNCTDMHLLCVEDFGIYKTNDWLTATPDVANLFVRNLLPETEYVWQVAGDDCNNWSAPATFNTPEGYIKHIDGHNGNAGYYYLIASPIGQVEPEDVIAMPVGEITPEDVTDMVSGNFDLYYFDQAKELEWITYKEGGAVNEDPGFNLVTGKGYLYANSETVDLVFAGHAYTGSGDVALTTTGEATGLDFPTWNLVGNPFAKTAYIDRDFYVMNTDGNEIITPNRPEDGIQAMEGCFVIATQEEETLTFSTTAPTTGGGSKVVLNLSQDHKVIDRAIVRFGQDRKLPKIQLNPNHTKVSMTVDGNDYAVVSTEEQGEMPVRFRAEKNGNYTLSVNSEDVSFAYLHLIDNLTGADVDLLETPSYSFEARTTDYSSRFKLVFATGNNESDTFAFFSNGSFVINNDGEATLQVIDVTGRILSSESFNGCTNVNVNAAPGVYMLRLINGDNVKVQKVVVK
jgi:hypothetical protein